MNLKAFGYNCTAVFGQYAGGAIAIQLLASGDQDGPSGPCYNGEPICRATVNLDFNPAENHVFIKAYAENAWEPIVERLQAGGIIGEPTRYFDTVLGNVREISAKRASEAGALVVEAPLTEASLAAIAELQAKAA